MTVRLVNDDPRCRRQNNCRISRSNYGKWDRCNACRREEKMAKAVASLKYNERFLGIPPAYVDLYLNLKRKVGAKPAKKMMLDQIEHDKRKAATA